MDKPTSVYGEEKPRLRGVSHQFAFFGFGLGNLILFAATTERRATVAILIYALSVAFLYGVSALYHRGTWSERALSRIRRLDHSAIFLLIAGSYTPLFMLLLPADYAGGHPLRLVWFFTCLGILKTLVWPRSPGWITTVLAIATGWCAIRHVLALAPSIGTLSFTLLALSGVAYTLGGAVYAVRRPNPFPRIFGYHEVFHALVITGGLFHYAHLWILLDTVGAV
ncbi:MAG: hemolysin III family protein [Polyangiaceae bacterium]